MVKLKKRYILLKDSVEYKKGAIFEEMCTDGTQDFKCITPEFSKLDDDLNWTYPRHLVMNQYEWFEEINLFWMTREQFRKARLKLGSVFNAVKLQE